MIRDHDLWEMSIIDVTLNDWPISVDYRKRLSEDSYL